MSDLLSFVAGAALGATLIALFANGQFVSLYSDKPYCEEAAIGDRTYTRCWKAVEVAP